MITISYKCSCMLAEVSIEVRNRREGEDVIDWMHDVQFAMTVDHIGRSPHCRAETVEYAKIPMPENAPHIGGVPRLDS